MPTYERLPQFRREFQKLSPEQQRAVLAAIRLFVMGLRIGSHDIFRNP